jgi:hypothetical protein
MCKLLAEHGADLFKANSHVARRATVFTDKKRNRCRKNSVLPGQLPPVLENHGKFETVRFSLLAVLLKVTAADDDNVRRTRAPAPMGVHEMWRKLTARTAMRVAEDQ